LHLPSPTVKIPAMDADGNDLLFITGAPGSRWSGVAYAISFADQINDSDLTSSRVYTLGSGGDTVASPAGGGGLLHFGNYLGPGMEFGQDFHELDQLGKSEVLAQLHAPYSQPGGVKLVKSHFFSRHLETLREMFPGARFVLVSRPDDQCFDWWVKAGGFSINFPDYTWYKEFDHMRAQIALDNRAILDFTARHGLALKRYRTLKPLLESLGLSYSQEGLRRRSESEFERRFGMGGLAPEKMLETLHAYARSAQLAFFPAAGKAGRKPRGT
jgi:hypothetical protein